MAETAGVITTREFDLFRGEVNRRFDAVETGQTKTTDLVAEVKAEILADRLARAQAEDGGAKAATEEARERAKLLRIVAALVLKIAPYIIGALVAGGGGYLAMQQPSPERAESASPADE